MNKVLYILGTGYCGSTALEMVLGAHSNIVNVGEVNRVLLFDNKNKLDEFYNLDNDINKNNLCSCGNRMNNCDYWKGFYHILVKNLEKNFIEKYQLHLDYFSKFYPGKVMVDSSKSIASLELIDDLVKKGIVIPLLLTKDIRNWTTSVQKKHKGSAVKRYIRWYIEHKKFMNYLQSIDNFIKIGYEEFALFPKIVLNNITNKLNLEFEENMLHPVNNSGHSVIGNRMRYDKNKKSQIFYDYRWFNNRSLSIASLIFPFLMKMNDDLVYSNHILEKNFNY